MAANPLDGFGYSPRYDQISPAQRRSYLEWLSAGRADADPAQRSLGHLFMFLYGLEQRIILDGDPYPTLFEELIRLLQHYGPAHPSRSLKSYFIQLLHFGGWQLGGDATARSGRGFWRSTASVATRRDCALSCQLATG